MSESDFIKNLFIERKSLQEQLIIVRQKEKELLERLEFVETGLRKYGQLDESEDKKGVGRPKKDLKVPTEYSKDLLWDEKTLFLLFDLGGKGTVEEMKDRLLEHDPEATEKVKDLLAQSASKLNRENVISANRKGRAYEYKLKN